MATIRFFFDSTTARVPEFRALMDELTKTDELMVRRIMREPGSPPADRALRSTSPRS